MRLLDPTARLAAAAVVAVSLAACSDGALSDLDNGPLLWTGGELPPPERITVCKDGSAPAGTYGFTISQDGGRGGTLLAGESFTLGSGDCADVWEALPDPPQPDPAVFVTVTEIGIPSGIQFDSLVHTSVDGTVLTNEPDATVRVNYFHRATFTYFNSATPPSGGGEGCTPGFWKQKQHFDSWAAPYTPQTLFADVFADAFPGETLLDVLKRGGGGLDALGRHAVAALLNAASGDVGYDLSTADVISMFNAAVAGGDIEGTKDIFEGFNEQSCPLD